jgi:hypothetical protein
VGFNTPPLAAGRLIPPSPSVEVEIEKRTEALWEEIIREKIEGTLFEVFLVPGMRRRRVRAYGILERPGQAAAWIRRFLPLSTR